MKFNDNEKEKYMPLVAPRVGAWIEITLKIISQRSIRVAPRVGAWIEIQNSVWAGNQWGVAPRVGAWIEICYILAV